MVVSLLRRGLQAFEIAHVLGCSTATVCADVKYFSAKCTQELVRNLKEKSSDETRSHENGTEDGCIENA